MRLPMFLGITQLRLSMFRWQTSNCYDSVEIKNDVTPSVLLMSTNGNINKYLTPGPDFTNKLKSIRVWVESIGDKYWKSEKWLVWHQWIKSIWPHNITAPLLQTLIKILNINPVTCFLYSKLCFWSDKTIQKSVYL